MNQRDLENYGYLFPCELREIKKGKTFYLAKKEWVKKQYLRSAKVWYCVLADGGNIEIKLSPHTRVKPSF